MMLSRLPTWAVLAFDQMLRLRGCRIEDFVMDSRRADLVETRMIVWLALRIMPTVADPLSWPEIAALTRGKETSHATVLTAMGRLKDKHRRAAAALVNAIARPGGEIVKPRPWIVARRAMAA